MFAVGRRWKKVPSSPRQADADKISAMVLPDYSGGDNSRDILVSNVTVALSNGRRLLEASERACVVRLAF